MFKKCTMCEQIWEDRNAYLSDPDIRMIGYQVNFDILHLGLFLFNHLSCETTLAIDAAHFVDLYEGPVYAQSKTATESCEAHCLHRHDLDPCASQCECAYVREIIQIVKEWPAKHDPANRTLSA